MTPHRTMLRSALGLDPSESPLRKMQAAERASERWWAANATLTPETPAPAAPGIASRLLAALRLA